MDSRFVCHDRFAKRTVARGTSGDCHAVCLVKTRAHYGWGVTEECPRKKPGGGSASGCGGIFFDKSATLHLNV